MKAIQGQCKGQVLQIVGAVVNCLLILAILTACADDYEEYDEDIVSVAGSDAVDVSGSWAEDYASYIETYVAEDAIPGLALALTQGNDVVLARGYGLRDVENAQPVTPDTLFHIGSTHKSMTAMLIATLVDDGIVEWDIPVVDIYPDFVLSDSDATETVTLRHLLSMRSGIPDTAEDTLDLDNATPLDVFNVAAEVELLRMPGEEFSYSNISASLAGYLGVIAEGGTLDDLCTGYAQLLQKRVLDPISMETATIYASEAQRNSNMARSYYVERGEAILAEREDYDGDALAPSGSLKVSVMEMAWYIITQVNEGVAPNGTRVVSASNLTETWIPYLEAYGMGWETQQYDGLDAIMHEGAYDNFISVIGFVPVYDVGFVLLANSEDAAGDLIEQAPEQLVAFIVD